MLTSNIFDTDADTVADRFEKKNGIKPLATGLFKVSSKNTSDAWKALKDSHVMTAEDEKFNGAIYDYLDNPSGVSDWYSAKAKETLKNNLTKAAAASSEGTVGDAYDYAYHPVAPAPQPVEPPKAKPSVGVLLMFEGRKFR